MVHLIIEGCGAHAGFEDCRHEVPTLEQSPIFADCPRVSGSSNGGFGCGSSSNNFADLAMRKACFLGRKRQAYH